MSNEEMEDLFSAKGDIENETVPVGPISLISMNGTGDLASIIDKFLVRWREDRVDAETDSLYFKGYQKDSFLLDVECPRFGTGEGKGIVNSTSVGDDVYILSDVTNHSITYSLGGELNHYSPDDHYQDLKRIIAAVSGRAKRINVIMPFLYCGRVNVRKGAESLDCAQMLKELVNMGVNNIITFDANDPRVQNAIPLSGIDIFSPTYQYVKALCRNYKDLYFDSEHLLIVSPDENGMKRAIKFASFLNIDMGMFYKRKDYSTLIGDDYTMVSKEFLGPDVEGKDTIIIDDMISSGNTLYDVAKELKERGAKRVFACVTFGLFTKGPARIDEAFYKGYIDRVFTTNLCFQSKEILAKPWHVRVNMAKYLALIIDNLNHDYSIGKLLDPVDRINKAIREYEAKRDER